MPIKRQWTSFGLVLPFLLAQIGLALGLGTAPVLAYSPCANKVPGIACTAPYGAECVESGITYCCELGGLCKSTCECNDTAASGFCTQGCGYSGPVVCDGSDPTSCQPNTPAKCNLLTDRTWVATFRACLDLEGALNQSVQLALLLVGGAALGRFLIGAFKYVISTGDPKSLEDARDTLTNAFLGLLLVASAYLIARTLTSVFGGEGLPIDFLGFSLRP